MADADWKIRVGIEINVSSGEEDCHIEKRQDSSAEEFKHDSFNNDDDMLSDFDKYGQTPPRTRILRRSRERRQRDRDCISSGLKMLPKTTTSKFNRRNTISNVFFNELITNANDEESDQDVSASGKRTDKRSLKLLRGSERDLKLDISRARVGTSSNFEPSDERAESLPVKTPAPIQIETANRFMSLISRPVTCFDKKNPANYTEPEGCPKIRVDFYKTFSMLIRMGCKENKAQEKDRNCRRHISQEEQVWQNELKDLIWLQLQAWHADRTVTEQDRYLCIARESIADLLDEIMSYRFQRKPMKNSTSQISVQSNDSGVDDTETSSKNGSCLEECPGCLSMYCQFCMESQNQAVGEIEQLLSRLEAAEALYPSNKSFGFNYPLYKSEEFISRVKAMCLWYNMTKHLRLKLLIIGKLLMFLQNKHCAWPIISSVSTSASSGIQADQSVSDNSSIGRAFSRSTSAESKDIPYRSNTHHIQFDVDESSPSDSNSSNSSATPYPKPHETKYLSDLLRLDCSTASPITSFAQFQDTTSPYRKYIEDVLKTKGLSKSLSFLERLHKSILRKAHISLKQPTAENRDEKISDDDLELIQYGSWSSEAQALGLPSYRSAFLFLSLVPMEVIHEFLRMRLEQKPDKPSPLSIRQLMREMKEGILIAVLHRQRVHLHFDSVLSTEEIMLDNYKKTFTSFDNSLFEVLKVYLDYLEQWALLQHETFQKSLIEEEWSFALETTPHIPGGQKIANEKFCVIVSSMLNEIGERLLSQIDELVLGLQPGIEVDEDNNAKENMFLIFRELQSIFNEERERTMKTISFTKTLRKDIVSCDVVNIDKCVRQEILDGVKLAVLTLKCNITKSIEKVQNVCISQNMDELDELERTTLLSRCREILHQAFRYGFEFHKEISVFFPENKRESLARSMVQFARLWMLFVKERCERGRGLRPRWAYQGLDFLMTVCEPCHTVYLTDEEFEDLKSLMDCCISHVIGTATPTTPEFCAPSPRSALDYPRYPRSRGSSPSPRTSLRSPLPRPHRKISSEVPPHSDILDMPEKEKKKDLSNGNSDTIDGPLVTIKKQLAPRHHRVRDSINRLELQLEEEFRSNNLIGCVTENRSEDRIHIRYKRVTFGWQRGIKIGQGRFGKVYTAVNNESGEMMAMKEITLQHNDHKTIRHIAEELRILEGINHDNLVKYYGIEIHREEMLIFMEFCTEGTLESLIAATEAGLPELLVRKFSHQMLSGVAELHRHGIVHRDIKSANIFLTDDGNYLKIGDFGSAVKIKAHTTMPGELQGFVGTQAYMAPEVFMKTSTEGHGRAADIWSVGCVVIEMASGKRPWAEFDSNYQIMFKVGMGETPEIPTSLSYEGQEFVDFCLQHDPNERATAEELLNLNFAKVGDGY